MSATGTDIPTAIATVLVFFGGWVSSADTTEDDDEGVGVADALMIEEVAAGVAGALLDTTSEVDSADDVGDADDGVDDADDNVEEIAEQGQSMSVHYKV
jgi:hypothetical protein